MSYDLFCIMYNLVAVMRSYSGDTENNGNPITMAISI